MEVGVGEDADAVKMMETQACSMGSRVWPECEERSDRGDMNIEQTNDRGQIEKNAIAYTLTEEMCDSRMLVDDGRWGQERVLMQSR